MNIIILSRNWIKKLDFCSLLHFSQKSAWLRSNSHFTSQWQQKHKRDRESAMMIGWLYLTLTTATKKISFFTFYWLFTKEATVLSWRLQSPKKGLSYEKCFVNPLVDYKVKPNFKVHIVIRSHYYIQNAVHVKCKLNSWKEIGPLDGRMAIIMCSRTRNQI